MRLRIALSTALSRQDVRYARQRRGIGKHAEPLFDLRAHSRSRGSRHRCVMDELRRRHLGRLRGAGDRLRLSGGGRVPGRGGLPPGRGLRRRGLTRPGADVTRGRRRPAGGRRPVPRPVAGSAAGHRQQRILAVSLPDNNRASLRPLRPEVSRAWPYSIFAIRESQI